MGEMVTRQKRENGQYKNVKTVKLQYYVDGKKPKM